jgi:hypothetical protein
MWPFTCFSLAERQDDSLNFEIHLMKLLIVLYVEYFFGWT